MLSVDDESHEQTCDGLGHHAVVVLRRVCWLPRVRTVARSAANSAVVMMW